MGPSLCERPKKEGVLVEGTDTLELVATAVNEKVKKSKVNNPPKHHAVDVRDPLPEDNLPIYASGGRNPVPT